jgi:amino acid permease
LLLVVGLIIFKGGAEIKLVNYSLINWKYALLPYGAILFAVDGNGAIPIVVQLLRRNKKRVRKAIIIGTFTAVVVVILFSVVITGISGLETSHDALTGLRGLIGSSIISFALVFGILTMITSFLGVSEAVREMLTWDYKIDKRLAWALALFVPYGLYIAGLKSFIEVISFAGAVAGGTSAIILVLIFIRLEKMKDKLVLFKRPPKHLITSLLIGLFIIGVLYEIINFINS